MSKKGKKKRIIYKRKSLRDVFKTRSMNGESILGLQLAFGSICAIFLFSVTEVATIPLVLFGLLGIGLMADDILFRSSGFVKFFKFVNDNINSSPRKKREN